MSTLAAQLKTPPPPRNLVLCLDGTNDIFHSAKESNIPVLYGLLGSQPEDQLCYYQSGIGTYEPAAAPGPLAKALDAALAWNLPEHVQDAYRFLVEYHEPDDNIFLFGFSRGAYTARALAGMLEKVGLLHRGSEKVIPSAFNVYSKGSPAQAEGFKLAHSRDVRVHFIGVFDTVSAVGGLIPRRLPFANGATSINIFRQALSLDEHRGVFSPQPWMPPNRRFSTPSTHPPTSVAELWFIGAHSDIGGGEAGLSNSLTPTLSHLTLRWMLREAHSSGLLLSHSAISSSPLYTPYLPLASALTSPLPPSPSSRSPSALIQTLLDVAARPEGALFAADALAPRGDHLSFQIEKKPGQTGMQGMSGRVLQRFKVAAWWVLEVLPIVRVVWDVSKRRRSWTVMSNLGRGRVLPADAVFHESVRVRIAAAPGDFGPGDGEGVPETKYVPKATFGKGKSLETVTYGA